jgi:hypothetical protein
MCLNTNLFCWHATCHNRSAPILSRVTTSEEIANVQATFNEAGRVFLSRSASRRYRFAQCGFAQVLIAGLGYPAEVERVTLLDPDLTFYFIYSAVDPEVAKMESDFISSFEQKPLWQSLNAVKEGTAHFVPGYWWRAQTYYLANQVVDDLFKYLTDTAATTPVLPIQ